MGLVALLVEKMDKVKEEKNMRDRYSMTYRTYPRAPLTGACKTLRGWLGGTRPIEVTCGGDLRARSPLVQHPERTGFVVDMPEYISFRLGYGSTSA